jgi:uncharacterized protein YjbI with pentapeptide repeats
MINVTLDNDDFVHADAVRVEMDHQLLTNCNLNGATITVARGEFTAVNGCDECLAWSLMGVVKDVLDQSNGRVDPSREESED